MHSNHWNILLSSLNREVNANCDAADLEITGSVGWIPDRRIQNPLQSSSKPINMSEENASKNAMNHLYSGRN